LLPSIKVYFYTGLQGSKEDFHEIPILNRIGQVREKDLTPKPINPVFQAFLAFYKTQFFLCDLCALCGSKPLSL
jgi:hypothetical protein